MKKNNKKGFTLVELVIVVAVMAILVAIAIPTVSSITGSAKGSVYNSNAKTIESMLKLAQADADDGTGAGAVDYAAALNAANLGIKASSTTDKYATFYYNTKTLVVQVATKDATTGKYTLPTAAGQDEQTITFSTTGEASIR